MIKTENMQNAMLFLLCYSDHENTVIEHNTPQYIFMTIYTEPNQTIAFKMSLLSSVVF